MEYKRVEVSTDAYGRNPVFYRLTEDGIHISSDIGDLIKELGGKAEINRDALKMYLIFQYVPTSETIVKNIFRLPPNATLSYSKETGLQIQKDVLKTFSPEEKTLTKAANDIRESVVTAIRQEPAANGAKGCFLFGGVDSSLLTAILKPDYTFTFAFDAPGCDESPLAKQLSRSVNAENICKYISAEDYFAAVPKVQKIIGQPYANLTGSSVYYLTKLASETVQTVYSGEGPDELFGGYDAYVVCRPERIIRRLPYCVRKLMAAAFSHSSNRRLAAYLDECTRNVEETYIGQTTVMSDAEADQLLRPDFSSSMVHTDITVPIFQHIPNGTVLDKRQYLDMHIWTPYDNTYSLFAMGRHFGLDIRTPFLSDAVVDSALSLKEEYRVKGKKTKIAFRQAASSFLPKEACERAKKVCRCLIRSGSERKNS